MVDLGCWPGGWLQVAAELVGPSGRVVGVDMTPLEHPLEIESVVTLCAGLTEPDLSARVREALGGPADVLLCDVAPKLTGVRATDRAREEELLLAVETRLDELLRRDGSLVLKLLEGPESQAIARRLRKRFGRARIVGLRATRPGSSERYLVGRDLQPPPPT